VTSLAERLGYSAGERLLIVNCDDLGSSHAANCAVERAMSEGVATSATLMVPCPWAREAAARLAGRDIGVHLTFTAEYPGYRWRSLTGAASLRDDDGFMPRTAHEAIAKAAPEDIRAEGRAQVEQALAWGLDVTHLDSHMGVVQIDSTLFEIYLDLACEFRLPLRMFGVSHDAQLGVNARARAAKRGVIFTDHLLDPWGGDLADLLRQRLPALRPGVTEIFGHPAEDGAELRGYDQRDAGVRVADARTMLDPDIARGVAASGATRISYRPLRELQRASRARSAAEVELDADPIGVGKE
jgi:hypothetical protein